MCSSDLGITCTFGNGTTTQVFESTSIFLEEIGRTEIPLLLGAKQNDPPISEAAHFIVDTVHAHPEEISFVGIGSLTNLYGAYLLDNTIFEQLKEIVLMGFRYTVYG